MILGTDIILNLVNEKSLVSNLCNRELNNPEGAGFDIRVGEVYTMEGECFLGVEKRKTPDIKKVAEYGKDKEYVLKPGEYVLIKTMESVKIPDNIAMFTFARGTLQRCGVLLLATKTDPGYYGELTFALKNLGDRDFRFELGTRVAHVMFMEVAGKTELYRGQWKGGRVTTGGFEKQV